MPFKDTEAFLPDCLDSILDQGYQHWELIAVNDGSVDSSSRILHSFSRKDDRIQVIENKGLGIIPALRTAHHASRGALLTRMDSDDKMSHDRLQSMAETLIQKGPGHLAVGQVRYFANSGISDGYARYERWLNSLTARGMNFSEIYKECVIPSPCWMAWRDDLEACGAFDPNRYPEDYDLCFRFYRQGLHCIPCKKVLHFWRDYPERTSRNSEHYAQNYFLEIKTHYFLQLHHDKARRLHLWGAGFKGKQVAKLLLEASVPFTWVCDNPRKIGKQIYGVPLRHFEEINGQSGSQSIITVANEDAQEDIRAYFKRLDAHPMEDYFFFC